MLDLFAIALMLLSLFLAPEGAQTVLVDVYRLERGRVETVRAERTATGFRLLGPGGQVMGTATRSGDTCQLVLREEQPISFPLGPTIDRVRKAKETVEVELSGKKVRVTPSQGLTYLRDLSEGGNLMVVRGAAQSEDRLRGWAVLPEPWTLTRQAAPMVSPGGVSPSAAVTHFAASLMRGDQRFLEVLAADLSPELHQAFREQLLPAMKERGLVRFTPRATLSAQAQGELEGDLRARLASALERFGAAELVLLAEDQQGRDLLFLLGKTEAGWRVRGLSAGLGEGAFR